MKPIFNSRLQSGVTLVELVISIVILSIAMVAVMNSFSVSINQSADPLWRNKSMKLAQLYLDEILAKKYDDSTPLGGLPVEANPDCGSLGPDPGEATRADYNDVDDYDGTSGPPEDIDGNSLDSSYDSYRVGVTVTCDGNTVDTEDTSGSVANNHGKKIEVTVTPPGQTAMVFSVYKGNY